jgi:hypothetical protein
MQVEGGSASWNGQTDCTGLLTIPHGTHPILVHIALICFITTNQSLDLVIS